MNNQNNENLPEELQKVLLELVQKYEEEDSWVRKQQIKLWKKNHEFWHGIQFVFWSESRQDWLSPTETRWFQAEEGREGAEGPFYDFVINIFKAHGESVIAALSAQVPAVRFPPDNADDVDDQSTSKTFAKIADLIQRHNPSKKLLMETLFTMWNEGMIFAYHAPKYDKAFGTVNIPKYSEGLACDTCDHEVPPLPVPDQDTGEPTGEFQPPPEQDCPECGSMGLQSPMSPKPFQVETYEAPKHRVLIELYGPLNVKVPYFTRKQEEFGYLGCVLDQPVALLKSIFTQIADKLDSADTDMGQIERLARSPSAYASYSTVNENRDLRPLRRFWFRPWIFDGLSENQSIQRDALKQLFPDGCAVTFVGTQYAEARNECMDKYWTTGKAGLSRFIHSDALGQPLIPVQELRNVLTNLTAETIEHGIPSGFADPEVLNFEVYSQHEARPGMIYPAQPKPGQNLGNAFYESARATLSQEVEPFAERLDQDGQFVTGAFPSIYGGPSEGTSRTASEYNQSKQMALQRLSLCWVLVTEWWCKMIEKCVHLYIENMVEDERFVQKVGPEQYVNVWIRQSQLMGRVGEVETEPSEQFPVSSGQKKQLLLDLLQLNNDFINTALFDPENRKEIANALSYPDLFIPGEDQRNSQLREIQLMLQGKPQQVDPDIDDSEIHAGTLKNYMASAAGFDIKNTQPPVWQLLKEHLMMHLQAIGTPEPEPPKVAVNLGIQGKDLGDPAVKDALVKANVIDDKVPVEAVIPPVANGTNKKEAKNGKQS